MKLVADVYTLTYRVLEERTKADPLGRVTVEGKFQHEGIKNRNGRVYPRGLWERHLRPDASFKRSIKEGRVVGQMEHPEDGRSRVYLTSHVVEDVWMGKDGEVWGRITTTTNDYGRNLAELLRNGITLGISSRGVGSTKMETYPGVGEADVVQEDFEPTTFDIVSDPSTPGAQVMKENLTALAESLSSDPDKLAQALAENEKELLDVQLKCLEESVEKNEVPKDILPHRIADIRFAMREKPELREAFDERLKKLDEAITVKSIAKTMRDTITATLHFSTERERDAFLQAEKKLKETFKKLSKKAQDEVDAEIARENKAEADFKKQYVKTHPEPSYAVDNGMAHAIWLTAFEKAWAPLEAKIKHPRRTVEPPWFHLSWFEWSAIGTDRVRIPFDSVESARAVKEQMRTWLPLWFKAAGIGGTVKVESVSLGEALDDKEVMQMGRTFAVTLAFTTTSEASAAAAKIAQKIKEQAVGFDLLTWPTIDKADMRGGALVTFNMASTSPSFTLPIAQRVLSNRILSKLNIREGVMATKPKVEEKKQTAVKPTSESETPTEGSSREVPADLRARITAKQPKLTESMDVMAVTTPDPVDGHIHYAYIDLDGTGYTDEAGDEYPHSHDVTEFQVTPTVWGEYASTHPGGVEIMDAPAPAVAGDMEPDMIDMPVDDATEPSEVIYGDEYEDVAEGQAWLTGRKEPGAINVEINFKDGSGSYSAVAAALRKNSNLFKKVEFFPSSKLTNARIDVWGIKRVSDPREAKAMLRDIFAGIGGFKVESVTITDKPAPSDASDDAAKLRSRIAELEAALVKSEAENATLRTLTVEMSRLSAAKERKVALERLLKQHPSLKSSLHIIEREDTIEDMEKAAQAILASAPTPAPIKPKQEGVSPARPKNLPNADVLPESTGPRPGSTSTAGSEKQTEITENADARTVRGFRSLAKRR